MSFLCKLFTIGMASALGQVWQGGGGAGQKLELGTGGGQTDELDGL